MPDYKCLTCNKFRINDYQLIPLREEDIYKIKNWRNEQMDILRQKKVLTDADQEKYFKEYILPTFSEENPRMILFSFLGESDRLIGYGGLTNVDWEKEYTEPMMQGVNTFRSYVMAWYDGTLDTIFFADKPDLEIKNMICSVLAGYVWDTSNPYVKDHHTALAKLARLIDLEKRLKESEPHHN